MFALFGLAFELIKISILTVIYSLLLLFLSRLTKFIRNNNVLYRSTKNILKFCLLVGPFIFLGLSVFLFTHYGNHGLGDDSRVPINYGQTISNIDDRFTFFNATPDSQVAISNYIIKENKIFANGVNEDENSSDSIYIVYDLITKKLTQFKTKKQYSDYAAKNSYPSINEFYDFGKHYDEYWNRWRFWLLP